MLGKLARRLGFQQSVPVAVIDDWFVPSPTKPAIELAPREGAASCSVDQFGRIQIVGESWILEFTLAAGARWVPISATDKVKQTLLGPAVVETRATTPAGPITQRVAAGVVDGQPAAVVEIENTGGVAIAVGVVLRPLRLDGRGHVAECSVNERGIEVDGSRVVRFESTPASVAAADGAAGDLLMRPPEATDGTAAAAAKCRSGGAQAAAVWPLPHTATLRMVVELTGETSPDSAVPTTDDIARGWDAHLRHGMRVDVGDLDIAEELAVASRSLLTLWPEPAGSPTAVAAISELGFGRDAPRLFELLERCDDDAAVLRSLARWAQLGEQHDQLEPVEQILGRLAQAAHVVASAGTALPGSSWLPDALVVLGGRLHQIGQPDVAERVQSLVVDVRPIHGAYERLAAQAAARDRRGMWGADAMAASADYVRALRSIIADDGPELSLLPEVPLAWRGHTLDVFALPISGGTVSFGLRWHGPRPALLWEANLAPEVPFVVRAPGIDSDFVSTDRQGETLLADPGWATS